MHKSHDDIVNGITQMVRDYEIARNLKRCLDLKDDDEVRKKVIWAASLDGVILYHYSVDGINGLVKVRGGRYVDHITFGDGEWV